MTREEAIDYLSVLAERMDTKDTDLYVADIPLECVDMAIEALEQEPCEDCVSRQAVNEIINDIRDCISVDGYWAILERMKKLPPVNSQEPCEDCISRQAVLEAIDVKAWEFCDYLISKNRNDEQKPVSHFADNLRECICEDLPSVKPQEQKTGHWIEEPNGWVRCSCCSDHYPQTSYGAIGTKFCPNCGARMEGRNE